MAFSTIVLVVVCSMFLDWWSRVLVRDPSRKGGFLAPWAAATPPRHLRVKSWLLRRRLVHGSLVTLGALYLHFSQFGSAKELGGGLRSLVFILDVLALSGVTIAGGMLIRRRFSRVWRESRSNESPLGPGRKGDAYIEADEPA